MFFIVDDTQCKKDRTTCRMEGLDHHFSHSDGKTVWSHSLLTPHLFSEGHSLSWDFHPYLREVFCQSHGQTFKSKNDLAIELIQSYQPLEDEQVYVLVGS
ncbi:hypothetical protein [Pseudalkalibacillus decolorationis]|uniref:hypothetical protein n=1 Tax=Pseudalkalibacillus decolorationis TaxID=163879 RepID=UPI002147DC98|nr:hypothetical protein [Pseudalkalibacillus decolorationis]